MNEDTSLSVLREKAFSLYDQLFQGVSEVLLLDVPDYPNVGDSAIFLGLLNYFEDRKIAISAAMSIDTLSYKSVKKAQTIVLMGGGSFGGLYPISDEHRLLAASLLDSDSLYIQAPQSVHFVSDDFKDHITRQLKDVPRKRLSFRDQESVEILNSLNLESILIPDSSIFLDDSNLRKFGNSKVSNPAVYLVRGDQEGHHSSKDSVDTKWLTDDLILRLSSKIRKLGRYFEFVAVLINPSTKRWKRIAQRRLNRGLKLLEDADVVITDRLHGMLIGLHLGRQVVALDNTNFKLTRYKAAWLKDSPKLHFVNNMDETESAVLKLTSLKKS